ncbi:MAG TPA: GNAT family N-acetyltransferase [Terriglobales bacterium]|jgi:CelD/BcsL family acetyltransferase involved in cellulose biosynthesis|nr:GNAT family N-acetyltransferase [Terriglobales bacterium]
MAPDLEYKTRVLTDTAQLVGIQNEWRDLGKRSSGVTPFQDPEWVISWADTFSPERMRVIEVRSGGLLVGLAPFLIYRRGEERVLAFMGGGISDYLDLLVDGQCEGEALFAIFHAIRSLDEWTTVDLTDLRPNSVLLRTELARFAALHDRCSSFRLPATREELLQNLSKRQRANLRQAHSRIQKAGDARVEAAKPDTLTEFLEDLFRLHASRWIRAGQPGVLADEKVKAFHRKVTPELLARGILRLYRLRLNHQTLAVLYALFGESTVFCYLQGYHPDFAALSPGTYLMFAVMEDAILSRMSRFDLLRGEEGYKQHWRAQAEATYRISLSNNALPALLSMSWQTEAA